MNEGKRIQYATPLEKLYFGSEDGILTRDRVPFYFNFSCSIVFFLCFVLLSTQNMLTSHLLQGIML